MNKRREKLFNMVHDALNVLIEAEVETYDLEYKVKANKPLIDACKTHVMMFDVLRDAFVRMSKNNEDPVAHLRGCMKRAYRIAEREALAAAIAELEREPTAESGICELIVE